MCGAPGSRGRQDVGVLGGHDQGGGLDLGRSGRRDDLWVETTQEVVELKQGGRWELRVQVALGLQEDPSGHERLGQPARAHLSHERGAAQGGSASRDQGAGIQKHAQVVRHLYPREQAPDAGGGLAVDLVLAQKGFQLARVVLA